MPAERLLLIVEDDEKFARTLKRSFERRDYEVVLAASQEDVAELLGVCSPNYAVVDLKLAASSGLACVQALYDAADDDSATGGPDLTRRIFPVIATVTADGFRKLSEAESEDYTQQVVQERMTMPDGPSAPLRTAR